MATAAAISPGLLILLLYLQKSLAQQCLNNGYKNTAGLPQQNIQKSSCGLNQISQNGLNFNSHQQGSAQQVNYQQQSNIQPLSFAQQVSNQPQFNLQQGNSLQPVNPISNSKLLKQSNQDLAANIFSSLYNIKQSAQNQRGTRNIVKGNPSQQNYEQSPAQNQLSPIAPTNIPQNNQPTTFNSGSEYSQSQPAFTFKFVPNNNLPVQSNQQVFAMPVQKVSTNDPNHSYLQSQPATNSVPNQQSTTMQSPIVMFSGTQMNSVPNQPIVLALQSPQTPIAQNQPTLLMTQPSPSQSIMYAIPTQPSPDQNQQIAGVTSQNKIVNTLPMDKQSLISYVVSQMQNPQGNSNLLTSILPAMLNTRSEKSSSMKSLLPLILNIIGEKKNCCGCPQCGHNGNNNEEKKSEPVINTGYSNHINYSQQKTGETAEGDSIKNDATQEQSNDAGVNNSTEASEEAEEDEAEPNDSEEYDE